MDGRSTQNITPTFNDIVDASSTQNNTAQPIVDGSTTKNNTPHNHVIVDASSTQNNTAMLNITTAIEDERPTHPTTSQNEGRGPIQQIPAPQEHDLPAMSISRRRRRTVVRPTAIPAIPPPRPALKTAQDNNWTRLLDKYSTTDPFSQDNATNLGTYGDKMQADSEWPLPGERDYIRVFFINANGISPSNNYLDWK